MAKAATKTTAKKPVAKKPAVKKTAEKKPTKRKTAKQKAEELAEAERELALKEAEAAKPRVLTHKLDMTHIETKRMLAVARKSGLLTTEELGKHIKIEGISAEDIEVALAQLSDLGLTARMTRYVCICVKWALSNCFRARVRSRLPSVLKPAATR